jgi:hypothetical protein
MKNDHQGEAERILNELGQKIDVLIEEAKNATGALRDNLEEKVKGFKEKKWKLDNEYQEFKTQNEGKWEEVKIHLSGAAMEIEKAARAVFNKKDN